MPISSYVNRKTNSGYFRIGRFVLISVLIFIGTNTNIIGQERTSFNVHAKVSGMLNCINSSVRLTGSSDNKNMVYRWEGPDGYLATAKESVTSIPGTYNLTATDPASGKTYKSSVTVSFDTVAPAGVTAGVSGKITCRDSIVSLKGSSSTEGVDYRWEGPLGFSSKAREPMTAIPGFYRLKVTDPANGCTSAAKVQVGKNIEKPKEVDASASGTLTCKTTGVTLKGTSSTGNVKYAWSGPDLTAGSPRVNVAAPGEYKLKVTNPDNGCSVEAKVNVKQNIIVPKDVIVVAADTLDCRMRTVNVKAISGSEAMSYAWKGPDNFISNEKSFNTYKPGNYSVKITDPGNGCSIKREVQVVQDTARPEDVQLAASGKLTCLNKKIILTGKSQLSSLSYNWSGPDNFISDSPAPEVNDPGKYQAIITNNVNGCSSKRSITVSRDTLSPSAVSAEAADTLSCSVKSVKLNGSCKTSHMVFKWTGPNNFSGKGQSQKTSFPGSYTLTVLNPLNGCSSTANAIVVKKECAD